MRELLDELKRDEGFREKPYLDAEGNWTVGYGWNLHADPPDTQLLLRIFRIGVTKHQAEEKLLEHACIALRSCARHFEFFWSLDAVRRDVVTNMVYNLGIVKLMEFRRMIGHLRNEEYDLAAGEMLNSKWAKQVGARADRLAQMMKTGMR